MSLPDKFCALACPPNISDCLFPPSHAFSPSSDTNIRQKKPATRDARQFVQAQKGKFSSAPAATHSNDSNYNVLLCGVLYSLHEEVFVFIFCENVYFRSKNEL